MIKCFNILRVQAALSSLSSPTSILRMSHSGKFINTDEVVRHKDGRVDLCTFEGGERARLWKDSCWAKGVYKLLNSLFFFFEPLAHS